MVCVGQGPLRDVPGLVPSEMCLVEEDAHQLRHRHRRVGIVELDGRLLRERAPVGVARPEAPQEIGKRAGHEEIFLHEAQALSDARGIVGIEHPSERFAASVWARAPTKSPLLNA